MQSDESAPNSTRQFATFFINELYFGIEVRKVQEVLRYQEMTHVPLAPKVIRGLINLRGQIVTAFELRERLNLPPRGEPDTPMNIVVRADDGAVSLLVDEIGDVIEVSQDRFESVPETIGGNLKHLLEGVYKLDGRLLLVLDTDRTLNVGNGMDLLAS